LFPDLDTRDDVPDELEVDLGHGDAGLVARSGDGDRHVRLGFLPEVDRAEPGLAGSRLGELRVARKILPAPGDVHAETRNAPRLASGLVEVAQVGDRRHLAQQLEEVYAPLLKARPAELRQPHPAELVLDLLHVGLDARRRARGLLALKREKVRLVLLI